jgi:hypothetical protein
MRILFGPTCLTCFEQPSLHKMTVAVKMARNNQEMEQQKQAMLEENKHKE